MPVNYAGAIAPIHRNQLPLYSTSGTINAGALCPRTSREENKMDYDAARNLADQIEKEVNAKPDFWTQDTYWNKCRTIVEMRHPKMDVMKQARLVGKMMQEKFPS